MSDLNIQAGGTLLEIACVVTDKDLNIVAEVCRFQRLMMLNS